MRVAFDIETNPIEDWLELSDLKEILCMAVSVDGQDPKIVPVTEGLELLDKADQIVGHNIISFDLQALLKLHGWYPKDPAKVMDTLVTARLLFTDQRDQDFQNPRLPKELIGSHSLKAWGIRLGVLKSDAPSFTHNSTELMEYCIQDVRVTNALHDLILADATFKDAAKAIHIEHMFARIIRAQERHGFRFDIPKAENLHAEGAAGHRVQVAGGLPAQGHQAGLREDGQATEGQDRAVQSRKQAPDRPAVHREVRLGAQGTDPGWPPEGGRGRAG
jgi:hypothetical protein